MFTISKFICSFKLSFDLCVSVQWCYNYNIKMLIRLDNVLDKFWCLICSLYVSCSKSGPGFWFWSQVSCNLKVWRTSRLLPFSLLRSLMLNDGCLWVTAGWMKLIWQFLSVTISACLSVTVSCSFTFIKEHLLSWALAPYTVRVTVSKEYPTEGDFLQTLWFTWDFIFFLCHRQSKQEQEIFAKGQGLHLSFFIIIYLYI